VLSTVNALAELVVVTFPATSVSTIVYVTAPFPVRFATVPVHEVPLPVRVTVGVPAPLNVTTGATDRISPDVTLIVTDVPDLNGPLADPFRNVTALATGAVVSITSAFAFPSDPVAPGLASVRVALFPAPSAIVPLFSASDVVAA
jgi:hypothetical protein